RWDHGCADPAKQGSGTEGPEEPVGGDHVVGAEVVDGGVVEAEQGGVDAAAQDVEDVLDAGLAVGGQPPQVGAADHHRAGTERDRLNHVGAATDAAVEQHLDLPAHRLGDRGQDPDRGGRAVDV